MYATTRSLFRNGQELLYLNSFFSLRYTFLSLLFKGRRPVLLAPRGELLPGGVASKSLRKKIYIYFMRISGLCRDIHWHATSEAERDAILSWRLGNGPVYLVPDFPGLLPAWAPQQEKSPGELRILFLARIHPSKGLHRLLALLPLISGKIYLRIIGPASDSAYEKSCKEQIRLLPSSIDVSWEGPLPHSAAIAAFRWAHVYVLPTVSENHGYSIQESLQSGCPVIIGRQTPWSALLGMSAGLDLDIEDQSAWIRAINQFIGMDETELSVWRTQARRIGERSSDQEHLLDATLSMIQGSSEALR